MTRTDRYGNALSTGSDAARDAYVRGIDLFLSAGLGTGRAFADAIEADPGFALAHAAMARVLALGGRPEEARAALARTESATMDARERSHVGVIRLAVEGRAAEARAATRAHVADHPRDALIAQICTSVFGLIGFSGEVGREAELYAYTSGLMPHYGEDWWMMSMHALSLCEVGRIDESQRLMDRSLALEPRNANASHFKAHALYEAGETAAGRAFLSDWMAGYDPRAPMHGHLTWHQALWALADGDLDAMWEAVDAGVGPGASKGPPINVLTDTASILHRAELAGVAVDPARWAAISAYAAERFPDPGQSFVDMHAALAHAMAGEGDRLARIAERAEGFAGDLARPAAAAWGAMARQDWATALEALTPVMATHERFGGSRAQRDLLELSWASLLMRLGRGEEARRALAGRRPVLASLART